MSTAQISSDLVPPAKAVTLSLQNRSSRPKLRRLACRSYYAWLAEANTLSFRLDPSPRPALPTAWTFYSARTPTGRRGLALAYSSDARAPDAPELSTGAVLRSSMWIAQRQQLCRMSGAIDHSWPMVSVIPVVPGITPPVGSAIRRAR